MLPKTTAQRLGYPADARLLIVNADDFGMCHAENGIDVTHLDSHIGTLQLDPRYHELYVRLAAVDTPEIRAITADWA